MQNNKFLNTEYKFRNTVAALSHMEKTTKNCYILELGSTGTLLYSEIV